VVFLHYELNPVLVTDRRASRYAKIERRTLKNASLNTEQERRLADMRPVMLSWPGGIEYIHTPGWTAERTIHTLHSLRAEGKCDVVVVDYLEKIAPASRQLQQYGHNQYQREADNVEQFKTFSESTGTPVLMLAQMSKSGKGTSFQQLDRTAIRGAGEKTEKANIVVLLSRDREEGGTYSPVVDVRIDKNTLGPTTNFQQHMNPEYFLISDFADEK
jgi:hypothetical protein